MATNTFFSTNQVWQNGVRQLETSDPVLGGPDGVSNTAPRQLAWRTDFLLGALELVFGKFMLESGGLPVKLVTPVNSGGTGLVSIGNGNYLRGGPNNTFVQVTPKEMIDGLNVIVRFSTIPDSNQGPVIYVDRIGYMEWQTFGSWSGYATVDIGALVIGTTIAARAKEIELIGGTFSKSKYPGLWAWAQANGHVVAANVWRNKIFKFVDLGGDNFKAPDLRDTFIRATGTDTDSANARELGSYQGDAMRRLYGSFAGVSYSTYSNQPGSHWFNDQPLFKRINDGDTGWTYPQVTIDASQSTLQMRTTAIRFDTAMVSPTSTETRSSNTAFHLRLCSF